MTGWETVTTGVLSVQSGIGVSNPVANLRRIPCSGPTPVSAERVGWLLTEGSIGFMETNAMGISPQSANPKNQE